MRIQYTQRAHHARTRRFACDENENDEVNDDVNDDVNDATQREVLARGVGYFTDARARASSRCRRHG